MKRLMLAILLIKRAIEACADGCLRCSQNDKCLACETWKNYYLNEGTCVRKSLNNCQMLSQTGDCLLCAPTFFYDLAVKACATVPTAFQIEKCDVYNSDLSCKYCANSYYFNSGKCVKVEKEIANCQHYDKANICLVCAPGYILSLKGDSCVAVSSSDPGCATYRPIQCRSCVSTHIYNENLYASLALNSTSLSFERVLNEYLQSNSGSATSVCALKQIANCKSYLSANACTECVDGHYLESATKCTSYPKPSLDNCANYASESNCINCQQGFYLKGPTQCVPVVPVTNCTLYSTNSTVSKCVECEKQFYLATSGTCELRINSVNITNCTNNSNTLDQCQTCIEGYRTTDDGLKCLLWPANCFKADASSSASVAFSCIRCADLYFYDISTKSCKLGSIINCKTYENFTETCAECQNKYYLKENSCQLHSDIVNCDTYEQLAPNTCRFCKPTALAFIKQRVCSPVTAITGCRTYSSESVCAECDDGYYVLDSTCKPIPKEQNCLRFSSVNKCVKCKPDFTLSVASCLPVFSYVVQHCEGTNLSNGDVAPLNAICSTCKEGSYPFSYKDHFMCVENNLLTIFTSTNLSNCRQVEFKSSAYSCKKCIYGKYMNNNNCVDTCPAGFILNVYTISGSSGQFSMSGELFCAQDISDTSCRVMMANNQPENVSTNNECVVCNDGSYPLIDVNTDSAVPMNKYNYLGNITTPISPVIFYPTVASCIKSSDLVVLSGTSVVDKCDYYYKTSGLRGCVKCQHGLAGTLEDSLAKGFIKSCSKMSSCDDTIFRSGLTKAINSLASCHKCVELTKIPFIFVSAGATYTNDALNIKSYDMNLANPKSVSSGGITVDCLNPTATIFTYKLSNLPANCAIGLINIDATTKNNDDASKSTAVDRTKIGSFCVACAPGYKPGKAMDSANPAIVVKHLVPSCTAIPNCRASTWFNYCTQCQDGFVFAYMTNTGVQYNNCVQYATDPFCFAADIENPLTFTCKYCLKGYMKNADGFCIRRNPPKCKEGKFISKLIFPRIDFHTMLFLQPEGEGCIECETGFTAVQLVSNNLICTQSSYVAANKFPDITAFIPNCKMYSVDSANKVYCSACKSEYVLDSSLSICYPNANLKNCLEGFSLTVCNKCNTGYVNVSGKCESRKILRCKAYVESRDSISQVCSQCEDGYYLKRPDCVLGSVKNCKTYGDSADKCIACLPGFHMVYNLEKKPYCYPIDPVLNCKNFAIADFDQGVLTCTTCTTSQYVLSPPKANDTLSMCMPFQAIENCLEYQRGIQVAYSTFNCTKCLPEYFVKDNSCQRRTVNITYCQEYDPLAELCLKCAEKFFIAADRSACLPYPAGVDGCRLYSGSSDCIGCKPNFYFNFTENRCLIVSSDKIVGSCKYYSRYAKCETCEAGFALSVNKTCEQVVAKDCVTYANKTSCATCDAGKGLKNETGIINCVPITDTYCSVYEPVFPFKCYECKEGYLLDSAGVCKAVSKVIKGCIAYEAEGICKRCQASLVLVNKVSCETSTEIDKIRDANCADNLMDNTLACETCKGGYLFSNGTCSECRTLGCHFCNPNNQTQCIICKAGFYMDKNGICNTALYGQAGESNKTNATSHAMVSRWTAIAGIVLAVLIDLS
jgi:hypothetical protein